MPTNLRATLPALLGLGLLLSACGPIAFTDNINYKLAAPAPVLETAAPSHAHLEGDHIIIDEKIQFGYDSAEIQSDSYEVLDDVVKVMQENPQIEQLDVIGHTSSEGSKKHNDELSANRAQAVKDYLISHGVAEERMLSEGKGPSEPIADNETEEGREKNRRVEFKVTKMGGGDEAAAEEGGGARGRPGA